MRIVCRIWISLAYTLVRGVSHISSFLSPPFPNGDRYKYSRLIQENDTKNCISENNFRKNLGGGSSESKTSNIWWLSLIL